MPIISIVCSSISKHRRNCHQFLKVMDQCALVEQTDLLLWDAALQVFFCSHTVPVELYLALINGSIQENFSTICIGIES